jgi:hypothetical protein
MDLRTEVQEEITRSMRLGSETLERFKHRQKALERRLGEIDTRITKLSDEIMHKVQSKLLGINQKELAKALYDVAVERGVSNEGLLRLIEMMPEFEALMYFLNVRKFYRDHTAHSLRVAVLGDYLLDKKAKAGELSGVIKDQLSLSIDQVRTAWWFSGLLHDIGTPLEKLTDALNWAIINEILRCYQSVDMEISPITISLGSEDLLNRKYLSILM